VEAALVHVRSDGQQQTVPLRAGKVVIGRQDDCQIRIPSPQVSRHHCELTSGAGGLRVRDLGSSNGTIVNGQRVEDASLRPGDVLSIGPMLFVVRIDGEPALINPEALSARVAASSAAPDRQPAPPGARSANEDSSVDLDFDFDLSDDDDDQPAL
jgi:pSer/pThr/pTyr-binding forkhead associated (FHA) protein